MILLDENRIRRTLQRMAYQIVEEARGQKITMVGLNERGMSIAREMQPVIEEVISGDVHLYQMDALHNSSFTLPEKETENQILVVVDDVIFSGKTMHHGLGRIEELSKFEKIYIAVLVDRGHRKFPLYAGIVGLNVPTKLNEEVELKLKKGKPAQVVLLQK